MTISEIEVFIKGEAEAAARDDRRGYTAANRAYHIGRLEGIALGLLWSGALPTKELRPLVKQARDKVGKFTKRG